MREALILEFLVAALFHYCAANEAEAQRGEEAAAHEPGQRSRGARVHNRLDPAAPDQQLRVNITHPAPAPRALAQRTARRAPESVGDQARVDHTNTQHNQDKCDDCVRGEDPLANHKGNRANKITGYFT